MLGRRQRRYPSLQAFVTLRSRPSSPRYANGSKTTGPAHPSSSTLQDEGLRRSLSIPRPQPTERPM
jgi:hypothetical protein